MNPKSVQTATRFALSALAIGVLTACGGGGSSGLDVADGGIRGTGSSVGPVSGFGSVFVNGVRFETQDLNGAVESDDGITTEAELDEGMILRVDGEWRDDGTGEADRVEYDDTLRGEITVTKPWDVATKTATLSIYGLVVNIDKQTVIKGKQVTDLSNTDFVRVSGWRLPNGEFRASLLRVRSETGTGSFDTDNEIEVEGQVNNFDQELCTFEIGSITVECDPDITVFDGIDISELSGNPYIEVEGDFNGDVLFAREIEEDDLRRYRRGDDDDIEFAGPVSGAFDSDTRAFGINGLIVRVTSDTDFEDDLSESDLVPDLLVQIEGEFLEDGTVEAGEINRREGESEVEGRIAVNSVNSSQQTFRIGGVLVKVTPLTAIVGDDDDIKFQDLGGLQQVEVSGAERITAEGDVYLEAFKVEVDDDNADNEFELVGRLREVDFFSISILGVSIDINAGTEFDDTSRDQLLALIDNGERPLVEVEYEQSGASFLAEEIELEEDDDD